MKQPNILVVDLDGTLLRIDMLFESFWSAFSIDWRSLLSSVVALSLGKTVLKQHLANKAKIEVEIHRYRPFPAGRRNLRGGLI